MEQNEILNLYFVNSNINVNLSEIMNPSRDNEYLWIYIHM